MNAFDDVLGHDAGYIDVRNREVVILVDRSGSMMEDDLYKEVEAGIVTFLDKQKDVPGETRVTLADFDNEFQVIYEDVPLQDVPTYTLVPRGMTRLYDSLGQLVTQVRSRHKAMPRPERPDVILIIATDGKENASQEFDASRIKKLLTKAQKVDGWGWKITYLGANQDAILEGQKMGVMPHMSMTYDTTKGTQSSWAAAGDMTAQAAVGLRGYGYSDDDRHRSMTGLSLDEDSSEPTDPA